MKIKLADLLIKEEIETDDSLKELADSIKTQGQFQAIRVRKAPDQEGKYNIIFGRRRVAACRLIPLDEIDAEVDEVPISLWRLI